MRQKGIVLVVDDEPVGLEVVQALLHDSGYDLHFAADGYEALALAEKLRPDLILLDVIMPGLDGYAVCRTIRETTEIADVPVIMLTALNDRHARLQGIEAGADDFITKPFDRLELSVRVKTILRLNRYRRLMAERAKFAWVVETADDGYVIIDEDDYILYSNPQARLWLDLPDDESLIKHKFIPQLEEQFQCQPAYEWEIWPVSDDVIRHLVRPQNNSAETLWLQVDVMNDISAENNYLLRLRDVTSDVVQQRLTWTFHAQIQHKFRHPLSTLSGHLEILKYGDHLDENEKAVVADRAYQASNRLKSEILSILDYVSIADSTVQQRCRLSDLVSHAKQLRPQFEQVNLIVKSQLSHDDARAIPLSEQSIEMILWELVENAQKFHPQHKPTVNITLSEQNERIHLKVCDDGIALTPDQLQRMWQPYYQVEPFFTGQVPGMGLGLAMIASTIWGVGGTCAASNCINGAGIIVELTLPIV